MVSGMPAGVPRWVALIEKTVSSLGGEGRESKKGRG